MATTGDVRPIVPRERHPPTFSTSDGWPAGAVMEPVDDHGPLPLLDQLEARHGDAAAIAYLQREPRAIVIDFARAG